MTATHTSQVIGGVFDLPSLTSTSVNALSRFTDGTQGQWLVSGRGAIVATINSLRCYGVNHIHVPSYLCQSVLDAVESSGLAYSFYAVKSDFSIDVEPKPNSAVLLIHYFGWPNPSSDALRAATSSNFFIIEDASQAPLTDFGTNFDFRQRVIINLRKIGPVPIGAWCGIPDAGEELSEMSRAILRDALVAGRSKHSELMAGTDVREPALAAHYLGKFERLEYFLDMDPRPWRLPNEFLLLLSGVDWDKIAGRRRSNWSTLRLLLPTRIRQIYNQLPNSVVPLGLPIKLENRDVVRQELVEFGVLCPIHWRLPHSISAARFPDAVQLSRRILTLPIDQRYGEREMLFIAEHLGKAA